MVVQGGKCLAVKVGRLREQNERGRDGHDQGVQFAGESSHFLPRAEAQAAEQMLQVAGVDRHADLALVARERM